MKIFKFFFRFAIALVLALTLISLGLLATGNSHLIKAVRSTYLIGKTGPTINDYPKFENRIVKSKKGNQWPKSKTYNSKFPSKKLQKEIDDWETTAFLVIQNGNIIYENYAEGYSKSSRTNSFSMAKSFTSLAIGAAIQEGKINSVNQKVGDFIPEYKLEGKSEITIKDLLTMSSGIDFGESYGDPFGFMAKAYYGTDLYDLTVNKEVKQNPGEVWKYQGGNTLLLSFILEKATGETLSDYFSKKFWKPLGASQDALWTISEKNGLERAYCCFYSNARDFALIGQLILDSGAWNGKQLISKTFFKNSFKPINISDESNQVIDYYGYQWWMGNYKGAAFYYARGIQGQYIVAIPKWNAVLVRLGHKRDPTKGVRVPSDLYTYLEVVNELLK